MAVHALSRSRALCIFLISLATLFVVRTSVRSSSAAQSPTAHSPTAQPATPQSPAPQVIILKLDDITSAGAPPGAPVSQRWQRITDYFIQNNIKASYGIIGFALDQDNPALFDWIKKLHRSGLIEFWNHGFKNRKSTDKLGEFEGPYKEQKSSLEKTQRLAREKLGIELKAFGAHWSGTNNDTAKALAELPEIRMIFYYPESDKQFVFERVLTLENPTHVPDFDKFKAAYEARAKDKPCLALQGHPNSWDDARWAGFVKIIEYLKSENVVFMTPSEYLAKVSAE